MRIVCPACGVSSEVTDDAVPEILICAGCGKRIRLASPTPMRGEDDIDFDFSPGVVSVPSATGKKATPPRREKRTAIVAGLVGAMATAMLVVLVLVLKRAMVPEPAAVVSVASEISSVPWDREHRAELLDLKSRADLLATAGKWQQSYEAYQQILTFVGDHQVSDPVALTVVDAVKTGEDRAMSALLADKNAPTAVVSVPVPASTTEPVVAGTPVIAVSATTSPATQPTTQPIALPIVQLDPAQTAADGAAPIAGVPAGPPQAHVYASAEEVTDGEIGDAINKGVAFLKAQFRDGEVVVSVPNAFGQGPGGMGRPNRPGGNTNLDNGNGGGSNLGPGNLGPIGNPQGRGGNFNPPPNLSGIVGSYTLPGFDALCVYALLNAGRAMDVPGLGENDPFTDQILARLCSYNLLYTYHRSLRAAALAVFNRTQDTAVLEDDVRWLQAASMNGAYTYTMPVGQSGWDNSNSQYGLLGVWSGAQAGKAVSQTYWQNVERHWIGCAQSDGMWDYDGRSESTMTMTCAGVASLLVSGDYLESFNPAGKPAKPPACLNAGLAWLDAGDNCMSGFASRDAGFVSYGLYGLERVGLASGYKYFGKHDWYAEIAKKLVAEQHLDGSWGDGGARATVTPQTLIDTAYCLLFLARGRHPILFNKLRYDGDWNDRPRDVAHLARYAAHQLERPLNWQVVNLRRNWFDWMDSPVLYISGDKKLNLTDPDFSALRDFANGGGLIFTHADNGSSEFNRWVFDLVRKIFPKYELIQIPRDHPIYSTVYAIKNPQPLLGLSNGSRLLLVHSPTDVAAGWQLNWTDDRKAAFQMGVNLFVYAAGKSNLKNRLVSNYVPEDPDRPDSSRQIARLEYPGGEWDPEPYAWTRFSRYFQWDTHQAVEPVTVDMKSLVPGAQPMAVLTGTVRHDFTDTEATAARNYVREGGVLLIDACGGQADFAKSIEQTLLPKAFPGAVPVPIPDNHPLLLASRPFASDLVKPMVRQFASQHGGKDMPILTFAYGKGWVIYSRLDITTGLLGTQSWGILGFDASYAQALVQNAVLWAEARCPLSNPNIPGQK
jgi:hypothetical protein